MGKPTGPGHTHTLYNLVHLEALNGMAEGATVDYAALFEAKAVTKSKVQRLGCAVCRWLRMFQVRCAGTYLGVSLESAARAASERKRKQQPRA